jgi:hypothetical protein
MFPFPPCQLSGASALRARPVRYGLSCNRELAKGRPARSDRSVAGPAFRKRFSSEALLNEHGGRIVHPNPNRRSAHWTDPCSDRSLKGYSFTDWWLYGPGFFIIALPHSLLLKPNAKEIENRELSAGGSKKCPFCAELVKQEAVVCRYCSRDRSTVAEPAIPSQPAPAPVAKPPEGFPMFSVLTIAVIVIGVAAWWLTK